MGEYTPGPWLYEAHWNGDNYVHFSDGLSAYVYAKATDFAEDRNPIAEVFSDDPGNSPESKANARLIAAAPMLLEACAFAVKKLMTRGEIRQAELDALAKLREAIKAAENPKP